MSTEKMIVLVLILIFTGIPLLSLLETVLISRSRKANIKLREEERAWQRIAVEEAREERRRKNGSYQNRGNKQEVNELKEKIARLEKMLEAGSRSR